MQNKNYKRVKCLRGNNKYFLLQKWYRKCYFGTRLPLKSKHNLLGLHHKKDSNCKKCKNNVLSCHNVIHHAKDISEEVICQCKILLDFLKENAIVSLTINSNTSKWFFMRQFSFTLSIVYCACSALIKIEMSNLEKIGFNKVYLELLFTCINAFNKFDYISENNMDKKLCIDSLKLISELTQEKLEQFSSRIIEKDSDNSHVMNAETIKICCSKIIEESFVSFKNLSESTMRTNLKL